MNTKTHLHIFLDKTWLCSLFFLQENSTFQRQNLLRIVLFMGWFFSEKNILFTYIFSENKINSLDDKN